MTTPRKPNDDSKASRKSKNSRLFVQLVEKKLNTPENLALLERHPNHNRNLCQAIIGLAELNLLEQYRELLDQHPAQSDEFSYTLNCLARHQMLTHVSEAFVLQNFRYNIKNDVFNALNHFKLLFQESSEEEKDSLQKIMIKYPDHIFGMSMLLGALHLAKLHLNQDQVIQYRQSASEIAILLVRLGPSATEENYKKILRHHEDCDKILAALPKLPYEITQEQIIQKIQQIIDDLNKKRIFTFLRGDAKSNAVKPVTAAIEAKPTKEEAKPAAADGAIYQFFKDPLFDKNIVRTIFESAGFTERQSRPKP